MFRYIKTVLKPLAAAHDLWAHATMTAAEFAVFVARISEICAQDARNHAKYIVCRKHITFYHVLGGRVVPGFQDGPGDARCLPISLCEWSRALCGECIGGLVCSNP